MRILIVDDDDIARLIIGQNIKLTQELKATVLEAENGEVGIEKIADEKPDAIFLDLNMPVMNGFEVLEILNSKANTIPVYVVTSSNLEDDQEKCNQYKFIKGYFQKPFTQVHIQQFINSINL
tara:strand:+ start:221 stop:586 length:366 start_codon:yes stop_codon:yes gene_type:complete